MKKENLKTTEIEFSDIRIPVLTHYEDGKDLGLIALYSSSDYLEISKYFGNANSIVNLN